MKTKLSIAVAFILSLVFLFSACGRSTDTTTYTAPTFEKSENAIQFNAYAGPVGTTLTDEHMQKLEEAGFTQLTALYEGSANGGTVSQRALSGTQPVAKKTLELCEKYNIKYYVRDWVFHEMTREESVFSTGDSATKEEYTQAVRDMFCDGIDYYTSSAYAGLYGLDEPSSTEFERISWQIDAYNEVMAEKGITGTEVLVNLYPNSASNTAYGGVTYKEYLQQYVDILGKKLGYLSYDFYPFKSDSFSGSAMKSTMISNLEQAAYICKENNLELRTYAQAGGEDGYGYRDFTSIGDLRFQVYMNLAFGSRNITYYRYSTYTSEGDSSYAFLNKNDGTYNWTYDAVKEVNNEVHAMEDALNAYRYDGVYCYNSQGDNFQLADFKVVSHKLKLSDIPGISNVEGTENAVLTTLKNKTSGTDYDDAYMLVNYTDPYFQKNNQVKITFSGYKAIAMYRFGKCYVMPLDSDGSYIFNLYPGEGRLIIPLK